MAGEPASLRTGHARRSRLILTSQLSTDMQITYRSQNRAGVSGHQTDEFSVRAIFSAKIFTKGEE